MTAQEVLKKHFGYDSFRIGQKEIIETIISNKDALAIMPTGAGKSICYQVPALLFAGISLVISPLISLMKDQVKALNEAGIHAAYINSSLTDSQISRALENAAKGVYKIIYVAPERLESNEFRWFVSNVKISMITIDEAHCISHWGQDFRPSYLKIVDFINSLPYRPVICAFTATATEEVIEDIECILGLMCPKILVTGFDRENLYFQVETPRKKDEYILKYVEERLNESGIIYCSTRKNVDKLHELLQKSGLKVTKYHAGLGIEERRNNQDDFIYDKKPIIIATNAFGMGIDKSNVRYVIHYNMPQSMENYYQEAGRAGRDGEVSNCILLFSVQDIVVNKYLLDKKDFSEISYEDKELIQQRDAKRLKSIERYCRTTGCLRNYILEYFGEKNYSQCDNCGNCHREYIEVDMTNETKSIINCVSETKGRYGIAIVIGTLMGANRARLKELGTINYRSYGVLKNRKEAEIRLLISQLISEGYLYQSEDQYSVLKVGDISSLKNSGTKVVIRMYEEKEPGKSLNVNQKKSTDVLTSAGYELFEKLRKLRIEIAREEAMPPYIIFSDKTLIDMCVKLPMNKQEMLNVSGVGNAKFDKYGKIFIEIIKEYQILNNEARISINEEEFFESKGVKNIAKNKKYKDWVDLFPSTVVIKKEGLFFTLRGDSARIIGCITDLKVSEGVSPVTGSPSKERITNILKNERINYIVVVNDEVVEENKYSDNHFNNYQ